MSAGTEAPSGAWPEEMGGLQFVADPAMTIPGKGRPGENCGDWYPQEFCDECGELRFGESRCRTRGCPNCWMGWSRKRAEKIARRLGAARYAAEEGLDKRAIHATVSPPEGEIRTLQDVSKGFRTAYQLGKEKGVRGGVVVFHGYRVKEKWRKIWAEETSEGEEGPNLWAWVREHEVEWGEMVYWSPHYHILGLCRDFEADHPDEQDGWVARRIRSLESFKLHGIEGYEDMVGAAMYLLSHATFEKDTSKDCVRWFGELATTKFLPKEELSEGALDVVERKASEAAAVAPESGEESSGEGESEPCENCGSTSFSPIWEAGWALMDERWCDRIGRERERRLSAAFEWVIGERKPPPGLKHPRTEEEAREAFNEIL